MKVIIFFGLLVIGLFVHAQEADMVIRNANVYTVDASLPKAEAVGVKDGKIIYVGSNDGVKKHIGSRTNQVDANGKFLMPGLIEGHGHIHGMGASLVNLNLMKAKNWEEILALVKTAAAKAKPGDWIIGRGWHQEKWDHAPSPNHLGYPYYADLDKVAPNNPVLLTHASGHSSYVNGKALQLAGITEKNAQPFRRGYCEGPVRKNCGCVGGKGSGFSVQSLLRMVCAKTPFRKKSRVAAGHSSGGTGVPAQWGYQFCRCWFFL